MHTLKPYGIVAGAEFRSRLHYFAASLGGFVSQYAFGLIRVYILLALVDTATTDLGGYTRETAITYTWATQAIVAALGTFTPVALASRIRTGDVYIDLLKPLNLQFLGLAQEYGLSCYQLLSRGIFVFIAGMLTMAINPFVYLPNLAIGLVSLWLAITLSYGLRLIVASSGFWITETRAVLGAYLGVSTFLGGFMIPVHMFPQWLQDISYSLPFVCVFQTPVDIVTGFAPLAQCGNLLWSQLLWVCGILFLGHVVMQAGFRKIEVQGG